jgi:hypothetical protein
MLLVMRVLSIVPLNFKVRFNFFLLFGLYGSCFGDFTTTKIELPPTLRLMRIFFFVCLFHSQPMPWSAPLSRELLVFNSFVRSLTRALRTLLEVTSLNMLLRNDARQARDDFLDITLSLPFQTEVNTGFGILAKVYLDALTHINNGARVRDPTAPGVQVAKEMALDLCEETFPGVKSPKLEVERGFRFWDLVSYLHGNV